MAQHGTAWRIVQQHVAACDSVCDCVLRRRSNSVGNSTSTVGAAPCRDSRARGARSSGHGEHGTRRPLADPLEAAPHTPAVTVLISPGSLRRARAPIEARCTVRSRTQSVAIDCFYTMMSGRTRPRSCAIRTESACLRGVKRASSFSRRVTFESSSGPRVASQIMTAASMIRSAYTLPTSDRSTARRDAAGSAEKSSNSSSPPPSATVLR